MGIYRFRTTRGLRKKSQAFDEYEGTELKSEEYDSLEEYCATIAAHLLEELKELEDSSDDTD